MESLKQKPENRKQFIRQSCGDDKILCEEVESLLSSYSNAESFMETPAVVDLYRISDEKSAVFKIGQSLKHYEILEQIGAGGMGEVYLAKDTNLNRNVALKVLPNYLSANRKAKSRLLREARAVAKLDHPNICSIYEIATTDEFSFIVMQYVQGETLAVKIKTDEIDLRTAIDITIQIADALDEAHNRNIVHHDIKPANIIINPKGQAIVLDFGLAKGNEIMGADDVSLDSHSSSAIMGTVAYMSPEQARGQETDGRTDIWSLGVVLYQMLTGKVPFTGETNNHVIIAIYEKDVELPENLHRELQRIIRKSLIKEKNNRYQTAKELLDDLRNLRPNLDPHDQSRQTLKPPRKVIAEETSQHLIQNSVEKSIEKTDGGSNTTNEIINPPKLGYVASKVKKFRFATATIAFVLVLAGGFGFYQYSPFGKQKSDELSLIRAKISKLTNTGRISQVAISPDGKYVVYSESGGSIYLRQFASESNVEIVAPMNIFMLDLQFSSDGNFVYYTAKGSQFEKGALFRVPTLGGEIKTILKNINNGHLSFSPSGEKFAFTRQVTDSVSQLLIANADGTNEEKLVESQVPELLDNVAWSPDGKKIVYESKNAGELGSRLMEVQIADGSIRQLTEKRWAKMESLKWSMNGESLFMLAAEESMPVQLVRLAYPSGEAKKLTNDYDGIDAMSLTADLSKIAVVKTTSVARIWIAPADNIFIAQPMTGDSTKFDDKPTWLPDGRVIFSSQNNIKTGMWSMNPDGSNLKEISMGTDTFDSPIASQDGKSVYFTQNRRIWRMNIDGSNPHPIIKENPVRYPVPMSLSPDGNLLFYTEKGNGMPATLKISSDGNSEPVKVSEKPSYGGEVSPDGKQLAYFQIEDDTFPLVIAPIGGGKPIKIFRSVDPTLFLRWSPDGKSIVYSSVTNAVTNLLSQSISGGQPKKLTDFKSDLIYGFSFSRDGKQIALSRGNATSDVLIYSDMNK